MFSAGKKFWKSCQLFIVGILLCFATLNAFAEAQTLSVKQDAINLALEIEQDYNLVNNQDISEASPSDTQSPQERLQLLRSRITDAFFNPTEFDLKTNIAEYSSMAQKQGDIRDQNIARFFTKIFKQHDPNIKYDEAFHLDKVISPFLNDKDWFVRHRAFYMASLNVSSNSAALELAQDGLKIIPNDNSVYALEAKVLSTSNIAYLYNLLGDAKQSIPLIKEKRDLKKQAGQPVEDVDTIDQLSFAFRLKRDYETAKSLTETILRIEKKIGSDRPGFTEFRAASTYNQLGDFESGLKYSLIAQDLLKSESLKNSLELSRIVSIAGLGRADEARNALAAFEDRVPLEKRNTGSLARKVLHIQALLAFAEGDFKNAHRLMSERQDANVRDILSWTNSQTAGMLAALHNDKDRRAERAKALQTEADLKEDALLKQKKVNLLLSALVCVLLIVALAVSAFARYRSKIATEMEIAAKKAMAGEKSKAEFLAVMSHELRTPLNGILGMADILARKAQTKDMQDKTNIIVSCGQDLLDLVENIFDMTLIEGNDIHLYPERVNVAELIRKQAEQWQSKIADKNINFTAYIDPAVPEYMEIDGDRLNKAVSALLSNAAKFTSKGRVHLHVTSEPSAQSGNTELKIIVADTGVGISEEAKARLFQPFVQADSSMTRHFGGAGLGLAIAMGLSKLMDGDIVVNSREGRGSEFTLTINVPALDPPLQKERSDHVLKDAERSAAGLPPHTNIPRISSTRILIAEDDAGCQNVLRTLLEPLGAKLIFTINGQETLEALSLNHFDFVITDIRMPGMDGVTAVKRIRQSRSDHANIPIIALTADVASETNAKCLAAGVDIVLTKPVNTPELYAAIQQVQNRPKRQPRRAAS